MARTKERKMKKATKRTTTRHDHTALKQIAKANPKLRWQFKGNKISGVTYWQTLAADRKPQFWPWKEYRVAPGQGVSAEEKEATAKDIMAPDAWLALHNGITPYDAPKDTLDKILDELCKYGIGDAGEWEEHISMDMTLRQIEKLIANIKEILK